jgi:HlyD family secretion protein
MSTTDSAWRPSIRMHVIASLAVCALLVLGFGGWAATTDLAGAVIAEGQVVVETNVKKVQHQTGGIVGELLVREGTRVQAGDVLIRLDDTQTQANLTIIEKSIIELQARRAREEAERDGAESITLPVQLVARLGTRQADPETKAVVEGEARLFEIRRAAREGQKAQYRERIAQLEKEIEGQSSQLAGKEKEIEWAKKELEGVRELWKKNLVQFTRVTTLERDSAKLEGDRGQLIALSAQTRGKINETRLQILQIDQELRTEVGKDLADIRGKLAELAEKRVAAEDLLKRVAIRAPQSGSVHQLDVHTVGGVVTPGQTIMLIVPEADALTIEAKIRPQDINEVRVGQRAILRFTSFNQRTTPEIQGQVTVVSADVTKEEKTGATYYTLRIAVPESELSKLDQKMVPGMPVEAFVQTNPRTVMSYVVKPLHDQLMRAFRER